MCSRSSSLATGQWSYSTAFFELSFVPAVRLRSFCKSTKVERFRREMRQFVREIEATPADCAISLKMCDFLVKMFNNTRL
ncbi:hypothetical protein L1887_21158 [Cichorium endivia]|nr:hypothetical protein L1887_21158 [Cichorium endivia]